jgi:hypothetical protein
VQEKASTEKGEFIVPNELNSFYYRNHLEDKTDVLISVGSLRTLFDFTMGNFSRVVMLDSDQGVVDFNRWNLRLIESLGKTSWSPDLQRYLYLSILMGRQFPWRKLEYAIAKECSEREKLISLFQEFESYPLIDLDAFPSEVKHVAQEREVAIKEIFDFGFSKMGGFRLLNFIDGRREMMATAIVALVESESRLNMTYWGSNGAWLKLQDLIRNRRISVVTGDLSGTSTLKSIADFLKDKNEKVSVLDLSNSLDYLRANPPAMVRFRQNLENLSFTKDALVLLTTLKDVRTYRYKVFDQYFGLNIESHLWTMFAFGFEGFKKDFEAEKFSSDSSRYQEYLRSRSDEIRIGPSFIY